MCAGFGSSILATDFCQQFYHAVFFGIMAEKVQMSKCVNYRKCGRRAKGLYSRFCTRCFVAYAKLRGSDSFGNSSGNPGNAGNASARGILRNAGNTSAGGSLRNAGNASARGYLRNAGNASACGYLRNVGNVCARGYLRNAGNVLNGKLKKDAGKRSGLRRSSTKALVVKKKWLDLIFSGAKTWEIRGTATAKRGWIHFAESQAGGKLRGRARLVNCFCLPTESFHRHYKKHCVPSLSVVPYVKIYVWVLEDAEEFEKPFEFDQKRGAVIWVDV